MSGADIANVIFQNGEQSLRKVLNKTKLSVPLMYAVIACLENTVHLKNALVLQIKRVRFSSNILNSFFTFVNVQNS